MPSFHEPLVSICMPTYNRVETLRRALESALAQTYANCEVIVSDNASTDGTQELCAQVAAADPRVRYLRQDANRGPTANFNTLIESFRGDYALMLSDDDWLDDGYVAACVTELEVKHDHALVGGRARYFRDGAFVKAGVAMQLGQSSGRARVRSYYRQVEDNGTFYGVMRVDALRRAAPLLDALGNDWLLVAGVAFQGKVATLESVAVNRTLGETTSASIESIVKMLGLPRFHARIPILVMAWYAFSDIAWRGRVYTPLPRRRRVLLGLAAGASVFSWRALAWHLTAPPAERLGRRLVRGHGAGRSV